jgi:hypothetical protein
MENASGTGSRSPVGAPATATLSARDVLNWIAFKEVRPHPDTHEAIDFMFRWGDIRVGPLLEALEARANPQPFCIWQPLILDGQPWDRIHYGHRAFSPVSPKVLRWIRSKARQREGRLVTYAELVEALRTEVETERDESQRIDLARSELMEALRESRLTAWAKRDLRRGEADPAAVHEAVPANIFMDDAVVVTTRDQIGPDQDHPDAWYRYHGPHFRDVKFYSAEVLKVWPLTPMIEAPAGPDVARDSPPERGTRGGRPPKHDWDAFWIEIVLFAADNNLEPEDRLKLQKRMEEWTAERWSDPPDTTTIRKRLKRLFDARGLTGT